MAVETTILIIIIVALIILVITVVTLKERKHWSTYGLLLIVTVLYAYGLFLVKIPEEKVHFIEYGVLAFLIKRALAVEIRTKQVYVKGRDNTGTPLPVAIATYGTDGPPISIVPNVWTRLSPGGVANCANNVGAEGYASLVYSPGIRKAITFGKYHAARGCGNDEDENALFMYEFARNRWDVLEITEDVWSEHLPGIGHDFGDVAVDTVHDFYITHGNGTLNNNVRQVTYVYDLKAGRGKRMMPQTEMRSSASIQDGTAYSPDDDMVLSVGVEGSEVYDHHQNVWTHLSTGQARANDKSDRRSRRRVRGCERLVSEGRHPDSFHELSRREFSGLADEVPAALLRSLRAKRLCEAGPGDHHASPGTVRPEQARQEPNART